MTKIVILSKKQIIFKLIDRLWFFPENHNVVLLNEFKLA